VKLPVPWWAKISAKFALSRMPLQYGAWAKLNLFRHGEMDDPAYACDVFARHFERTGGAARHSGFVGLELGPGDSLASAVVAKGYGASKCYMVDAGAYARTSVSAYHRIARHLDAHGIKAPGLDGCQSLDELLQRCDGIYLTAGLASLRRIPSDTVDFAWSQAVLEHIRLADFDGTLTELHRVLRPGGVASHRIDLRDHLGGALNNLRFSQQIWEAEWMARSGFYTNRIRYSDMLDRFSRAGFDVEVLSVDRWERLPTPRQKLAREFRALSDDDLAVSGFDVILRPNNGPGELH
jgi:SAM-dependent methyltransferase